MGLFLLGDPHGAVAIRSVDSVARVGKRRVSRDVTWHVSRVVPLIFVAVLPV